MPCHIKHLLDQGIWTKAATPGFYWGYIGIVQGLDRDYIGVMRYILGLYWDYIGYILGLYRDNGKENGNYYNGLFWDYKVYIGVRFGIMENKIEATISYHVESQVAWCMHGTFTQRSLWRTDFGSDSVR